jgi:hypothetical protein
VGITPTKMNITQLCKEIRELEARLQNLSISDTIMIRKEIEDFWRDEHLKNGYELLFSPHIG